RIPSYALFRKRLRGYPAPGRWVRTSAGSTPRGTQKCGVDPLLEFLARLPEGQTLGRNEDLFARLGVAPFVGFVLAHREGAKATDLHPVARAERLGDGVEEQIDDLLGLRQGDVRA